MLTAVLLSIGLWWILSAIGKSKKTRNLCGINMTRQEEKHLQGCISDALHSVTEYCLSYDTSLNRKIVRRQVQQSIDDRSIFVLLKLIEEDNPHEFVQRLFGGNVVSIGKR